MARNSLSAMRLLIYDDRGTQIIASRPPAKGWMASSGRPSRSSDDDAQPPPGGVERLLDLLVGGGFGEQEAQVAVTVG